MTMRHAGTIASNKMAQAIRCNSMTEFWKEVKAHRKRKVNYPSTVDGVHGDDGISEIFASKYNEWYNVVSYNDVDMNALQADVDQAIINACEQCSHCCTYHTHDISASEVAEAIIRLKQSKRDGSSEVMSDHLLFACDSLNLYLALLFTMMLRHGVAPNDMLIGTIIPIPKGRWANLCL